MEMLSQRKSFHLAESGYPARAPYHNIQIRKGESKHFIINHYIYTVLQIVSSPALIVTIY